MFVKMCYVVGFCQHGVLVLLQDDWREAPMLLSACCCILLRIVAIIPERPQLCYHFHALKVLKVCQPRILLSTGAHSHVYTKYPSYADSQTYMYAYVLMLPFGGAQFELWLRD